MASQTKLDLYKVNQSEYVAKKTPVLVETQPATYLAIAGRGAPGSEEFQEKIAALYAVAYTVKMTRKFEGQQDYVVCKLEAQWWSQGGKDLSHARPEEWRWKLLIRTPGFVEAAAVERAARKLLEKGKSPEARAVGLATICEGLCVQMLHVGPYDHEHETVAIMRQFADEQGLALHGRHHEIYLSDPRRVAPERLKTIIRLPVKEGALSPRDPRASGGMR